MLRTLSTTLAISLLALFVNLSIASSAAVDWSWGYTKSINDSLSIGIFIGPSDPFDVEVDITNDAASDTTIFLAPYSVPQGYYYEGFYEFQTNIENIIDTAIEPGETISLNLGTWLPVGSGMPPYANIQAQPKYLDVYYYDNGELTLNGNEPYDRLSFHVLQAINTTPYDDNNIGQGFIMMADSSTFESVIITPATGPLFQTPIPSSFSLLGCSLLILGYLKRTK